MFEIAAGTSTFILPKQSAATQFITKFISLSKSKAIDLQITKFIVKYFHPFFLVEKSEFCNFIKMLAPSYIIKKKNFTLFTYTNV